MGIITPYLVCLLVLGSLANAKVTSKRDAAVKLRLMNLNDTIERLSTKIWPTSYFLDLKINLPSHGAKLSDEEEFTTTGTVRIDVNVEEETSMIQLHTRSIDIVDRTTFMVDGNGKETALSVEPHPEQQKIHLHMMGGAKFPVGTYSIKTCFETKLLANTSEGLYYYPIHELDGTKRFVATSQCEILLARMIVPCFDEPDFKAKWKVNITHPVGTTAIANGYKISVESCPDHAHFLRTQFDWTPPMSSYLLAVSVSHFPALKGNTKRGTDVRFYIREEYLEDGVVALKSTIKILEFLEELFDIEYPLPHLDAFVATKYYYGGMENYGLIVYNEKSVLFNPMLMTAFEYRRAVSLVAHEVTHQWFGDLVTMKWWNNTWLNEGLTSYVEDLASEAFDPNIAMSQQSLFDDVERVLQYDKHSEGQMKVIPVVNTMLHIQHNVLTTYAYQKGAAIMRMLAHTVKEEVLIGGLRKYLKRHAFGNADEQDLWRAIQEVVDEQKNPKTPHFDVKKYGEDWTTQHGYPIIVVNRTAHPHKYRLTQKRDAADRLMEKDYFAVCSTRWTIPVSYYAGKEKHLVIMDDKELIIDTKGSLPILNQGGSGYYRVDYSDVGWDTVAKEIENKGVPDGSTRIRLYLDLQDALNYGRVSNKTVFNFVNVLRNEHNPLAFVTLYQVLLTVSKAPENAERLQEFLQLIRDLKPSFRDVVDSDFGHQHTAGSEVKAHLYTAACQLDPIVCKDDYLQEFRTKAFDVCRPTEKFSQCSRISPLVRQHVYCYARKYGSPEYVKRIEEAAGAETHRVEKSYLRSASEYCKPQETESTPSTKLGSGFPDNDQVMESPEDDLSKIWAMEKVLNEFVSKMHRVEMHRKREE